MNYVSWADFFFFLTKVGGSRDLFLFKGLEKCSGMAMPLPSGLCHCLTRPEQLAAEECRPASSLWHFAGCAL